MPALYIPDEAWNDAKEFFNNPKNKKAVKLKDPINHLSFICVDGEIYAKQTREYLGKGGYGKVQLVQTIAGQQFAVKIEGRGLKSEDDAELMILSLLGKFHGQAQRKLKKEKDFLGRKTNKKLYTILDLEHGEELAKFLKKNANPVNTYIDIADYYAGTAPDPALEKKSDTQSLHIAFMCAQALSGLHANSVIHGDVKPENFMINFIGDMIAVAAIDFGLSLRLKSGATSAFVESKVPLGTPKYTPPEICFPQGKKNMPPKHIVKDKDSGLEFDNTKSKRVFSFSTDVYSLGIIFRDDLSLPKHIYEPMISANPKDRPSMNEVIKALANTLKDNQNFDLRSEKQKATTKTTTTTTTTTMLTTSNKRRVVDATGGNPEDNDMRASKKMKKSR
ncbi:MAG: protein kinase family protein [Candidatus Berkiella sp.]